MSRTTGSGVNGATGTGNLLNIDPLLGPLADNGGPALPNGAVIQTHALLPGSPALDAGGGPVALYQFEGDATDSTGGNNGTPNGGINLAAMTEVGGSTTAALLDGIDDFVELRTCMEIDSGISVLATQKRRYLQS